MPRSAPRRGWGARKIATCQTPVLFEAPVAIGLVATSSRR